MRGPGSGAAPCRGSSFPQWPLPPPTDIASLTKTCLVERLFVHNADSVSIASCSLDRGNIEDVFFLAMHLFSMQRNIALPLQLQTHIVVRSAWTLPWVEQSADHTPVVRIPSRPEAT